MNARKINKGTKQGQWSKNFWQEQGISFTETFSLVVKMSSIRVILGLVVALNLEYEQLDVNTTFLQGDLGEEMYMQQPEGFKVKGKENLVCRLKKSLYGLKQAPHQWYKKFDSFIIDHGFTGLNVDHCVYIKRYDCQFVMKYLGPAKQILGINIMHDRKKKNICGCQKKTISRKCLTCLI